MAALTLLFPRFQWVCYVAQTGRETVAGLTTTVFMLVAVA
jgi:hypothetical protein